MSESKESIIRAYRDLVASRGKIIGARAFVRETGVNSYAWQGKYWRSWGAFQKELGYEPNSPTPRTDDEILLNAFASYAQEIKRVPTEADLVLKKKSDASFPGGTAFRRWGSRAALLEKVAAFCRNRLEFADVLLMVEGSHSGALEHRLDTYRVAGFVYLLRSGKHFKIGKTNASGRRLRELAIQLPKKPDTIHVIETDDPEGIEAYWHKRFADKRQGGEWFTLSQEDVRAFKKRKFQ